MAVFDLSISSLSGISTAFAFASAIASSVLAIYLIRREPGASQRLWLRAVCLLGWLFANLVAFSLFECVIPPDDVRLLLEGQVTYGTVNLAYYRRGMFEGWTHAYTFSVDGRSFHGEATGPKTLFADSLKGATTTIIFLPANPAINMEMADFQADPIYQANFRRYHLYDTFRMKYGASAGRYSYDDWLAQTREE